MRLLERILHALGKHRAHRCFDKARFLGEFGEREVSHCRLCEPYLYHEVVTLPQPMDWRAEDIVYLSREDDGITKDIAVQCRVCGVMGYGRDPDCGCESVAWPYAPVYQCILCGGELRDSHRCPPDAVTFK